MAQLLEGLPDLALTTAFATLAFLATYIFLYYRDTRNAMAQRGFSKPSASYYPKDFLYGLEFRARINKDVPFLYRHHQSCGKTFRAPTLIAPTAIMSIEPANVRAANSGKDFGIQPARLPGMEPFCGRGFLTTDGEIWQHTRRLLKPSFSKRNIADCGYLAQQVDDLITRMPTEGATIDLQPLFYTMFLNTSMYFLLGVNLTQDNNGAPHSPTAFIKAFHDALFYTMFRMILGRMWYLFPKQKYRMACSTRHQYLDHYIDQALNRRNDASANTKSLLASLSSQTDDLKYIRSQILQGMMASQETTSALLGNAILLLSRHPQYWDQLRHEACKLDAASLGFDTLLDLESVQNVLYETLRLYPVFPVLHRTALQDTQLPTGGGPNQDLPISVPKGTLVLMSYYALHRDPAVFGEDVEAFRPERWQNIKPSSWEFMGFGGGNRACMGQQKALVEAAFVLVRLAQKSRTCESRDDRPWEGEMKLTCKSKHGCKVAFFS